MTRTQNPKRQRGAIASPVRNAFDVFAEDVTRCAGRIAITPEAGLRLIRATLCALESDLVTRNEPIPRRLRSLIAGDSLPREEEPIR